MQNWRLFDLLPCVWKMDMSVQRRIQNSAKHLRKIVLQKKFILDVWHHSEKASGGNCLLLFLALVLISAKLLLKFQSGELQQSFAFIYKSVVKRYFQADFKDIPASIYLVKVNNRNSRTRCEICLTIKTPERRHWCRSVFIVNFEHLISGISFGIHLH